MESVSEKQGIRVQIGWWVRRHMEATVAIENASFDYPWTEEDFKRCHRQKNVVPMVAEHQDVVLGFMVYGLHKTSTEILNFAVHPDFRRRGVGTQMVAKLLGKINLPLGKRKFLSLNISERNLDGQLFFRECRFQVVGVLRNHYEETNDDAYRMVAMAGS